MLDIKKVFSYDQNTEDQSTGEITQPEVDFTLPLEELLSLADSLQDKADRMLESYRLSDSEQLYKTILKIREKYLGENHTDTAVTYFSLGRLSNRKGMFKDAIDYYKKAIKINEEAFGEINIENWEIYNYLQTDYSNIGDKENLKKVNRILDTLKNKLDL